jgi:hypothetical protein
MAKNRKLLVIGASPFQVPLILKARELGYTVSATSYLKDDPGLLVADKGFNVSILDFGGLERLCQREGICAVATGASDLGTLAVGHLNDTLGLAGITEDQARSVSDKGRFVLLQKDLGLGLGESFIVTGLPGDPQAAVRFRLPRRASCPQRRGGAGLPQRRVRCFVAREGIRPPDVP